MKVQRYDDDALRVHLPYRVFLLPSTPYVCASDTMRCSERMYRGDSLCRYILYSFFHRIFPSNYTNYGEDEFSIMPMSLGSHHESKPL